MLTAEEIYKVFSWQPYREDWPVDRNQADDNINVYYDDLIKDLTENQFFDSYYSENGGLANYLEFICYPAGRKTFEGNAIIVCVNLCSPIAAYGQTTFTKRINFIGWGGLFDPEKVGVISDSTLKNIETEIKGILIKQQLDLIDKDFACRLLPDEVAENLLHENHNEGNQYLHGIFQKTD